MLAGSDAPINLVMWVYIIGPSSSAIATSISSAGDSRPSRCACSSSDRSCARGGSITRARQARPNDGLRAAYAIRCGMMRVLRSE